MGAEGDNLGVRTTRKFEFTGEERTAGTRQCSVPGGGGSVLRGATRRRGPSLLQGWQETDVGWWLSAVEQTPMSSVVAAEEKGPGDAGEERAGTAAGESRSGLSGALGATARPGGKWKAGTPGSSRAGALLVWGSVPPQPSARRIQQREISVRG